MKALLGISRFIDRLNGAIGEATSWVALLMVLVAAYNTVVRYLGKFTGWSLSSNLYLELQWYLFSVLFLLAAGWALREDAHVRVDVVFERLPARGRVWIDLVGSALLLLPFTLFTIWVTWPSVASSWAIREGSPDPGGLPRYPIKTLILVALGLLALQGVSQLVKCVARLRGDLPVETASEARREEMV